jgi:hypothetical protein
MTNSPLNKENVMTDSYRVAEVSVPPQAKQSGAERGVALRVLLWVVLVASGAANVVTSSMAGVNVLFGVGFGLVALAAGAALIVDHYRNRRPARS